MEYTVRLAGTERAVRVSGGTLAEACARLGHPLELVCGGNGRCGKCDVLVERGGVRETVRACVTPVAEDFTVFLEGSEDAAAQILTAGSAHNAFAPAVTKTALSPAEWEPEHCGAYLTGASLAAARQFSRARRGEGGEPLTFIRRGDTLLGVQRGDTAQRLFGAAVDIGTTTVAMYIYDLTTGALLHTGSALNGQIRYGADVIARIQHTLEQENGLSELNTAILDTIDGLLAAASAAVPGLSDDLWQLVFCGNSTMQHLFLGIDPGTLGAEPFASVTADTVRAGAGEIGLRNCPAGALVEFLPLLGGFVGADTTAVLLGVPEEGVHLAVDLGTNGEIAVGNARGGFLTSSTACGPALEGGNIECGMRGAEGAIDHAEITPNGELRFHVLGEGEAKGLCGSGIIDMTAALVRCGLVDMTGRLLPRGEYAAEHPDSPLLDRLEPVGEYNNAFFLTRGEHPVYLSQNDIRQIQLAKSSICAGCLTLCHEHGIEPEQLDSLILAGAFGNYIDVDNALYIGLLPAAPREKVLAVGNGAGSGVCRYLLDRAESSRCGHIRAVTRHVELNASAEFMEQYIMNMNFNEML